ncbi:hypothetical protein [Schumannella luteola]
MSTFRNPVGPQPAKVYWRRRLVVLLVLLAIVAIVVLILVQPRGGTPTPTGTSPSPSATADAGADGETVECDPAKVTIDPITDADSYDPGVNPQLSFTLKSTMTEPCLLAAGSDLQEFRITSGEELIWSSKDCQTDPVPAEIILQPGVPKQSAAITWDRTRSSVDTCDTAREPVVAGGASYHLEVSIGDIASATTKQFLLN